MFSTLPMIRQQRFESRLITCVRGTEQRAWSEGKRRGGGALWCSSRTAREDKGSGHTASGRRGEGGG